MLSSITLSISTDQMDPMTIFSDSLGVLQHLLHVLYERAKAVEVSASEQKTRLYSMGHISFSASC